MLMLGGLGNIPENAPSLRKDFRNLASFFWNLHARVCEQVTPPPPKSKLQAVENWITSDIRKAFQVGMGIFFI